MTSARDQLAELIHDTVYSGAQRVNWEAIADAILAAGWRPPKPPCEHRMIVHGGACGSCGQMPPPPTEEDRRALTEKEAKLDRMLADPDRYYAEAWERARRDVRVRAVSAAQPVTWEALLRTALTRIERDNRDRTGLDEFAKKMGVDLDG